MAELTPQIAKWKISSDGYYPYCSNCKCEPPWREMTRFCPYCGAKMGEEKGIEMFNVSLFSEKLRRARKQKQLSQAALARAVGVSTATISSYETPNGTKIPSLDKAAALAIYLEVSLDWLCGIKIGENDDL